MRTSVHARDIHWPLIGLVLAVAVLGIYNLHSAAAAHDADLYISQIYWLGLGAALVLLVLLVDYRVTETVAYIVFGISIILLVAVLLQGKTANNARRWLQLGGLTFQPSELCKIAVILCLSRYFGHRFHPGGYTMRALFRPLNPSRPLVAIVLLAVAWNKPFLADPTGVLARFLRASLGGVQPIGDLLWFRLFLVALVAGSAALLVLLILRLERDHALLNPWPRSRRWRLISLVGAGALAAFAALAFQWNHDVVRDPFGVVINNLISGAGPGGPYHALQPGWRLRALLTAGVVLFALASLLSLRHGASSPVDLLIAPIDLLVVPGVLVLVEPDLGTAGVIVLIGMTIIFVVGIHPRSLVMLTVFGALVAGIGWFGVLKDYQKRRVMVFLDPEHDVQGAGWNAVQSMIAVGSGRWLGKGHKEGTQTQLAFLPEQHTDFAFSVWAEEQGFLGCSAVLLLYLLILLIALSIAWDARERYGALLATGVAALIAWHVVINVGMVSGIAPVVGLTLPMFSYGGSSLVTMMVGIGLLLNIHLRRRTHT